MADRAALLSAFTAACCSGATLAWVGLLALGREEALRSLVVPQGPPKDGEVPGVAASGVQCEAETVQVWPGRISWARLLKRVFDIDMQHCPNCGAGELRIIAAILERPVIEKILAHLGLDPQPPPKGRVREAGLHFAA